MRNRERERGSEGSSTGYLLQDISLLPFSSLVLFFPLSEVFVDFVESESLSKDTARK